MRTAMVVLILAVMPLAAAQTVEGTVWNEGAIPGCTVTLRIGSESRVTLTNVEGRYRFEAVPEGEHDLTFELSGFVTVSRRVAVKGNTVVPRIELRIASNQVTLACGAATCTTSAPETIWDLPSCADEELHDALIENVERGDRSAIVLLRKRYDTADTYRERHRLAAALLGRVSNDTAIWNDLAGNARIAVRYPRVAGGALTTEFEQYCLERDLDPDELWDMSRDALERASADPRSRPMLYDVLKTSDESLLTTAIIGLGTQRDAGSLSAIKEAIDRLPESAPWLAHCLSLFKSADADEIAFRYLDEFGRSEYLRIREEASETR